ncbi:MAG: hypothetical protein H8E66_17720 [Planctomycetes bacterium]|nr:hypothetical protein [Planctomycetota bacterium]
MKVKITRGSTIALLSMACAFAESREPDFPTLDKVGNSNGYLEPSEIPAEYSTIIARYASLAGLDMSKPMLLGRLGDGRLEYFRMLDRSDEPGSVWNRTADEQGFGRIEGTSGIRQFGPAGQMVGQYTSTNRGRTRATFRSYDVNRDGLLSREEVGDANQKTALYEWFTADHDRNNLLTFTELADYYAADGLRRKMSRDRQESTWNIDSVKVTRRHRQHAQYQMGQFDKNKNGTIDRNEVPDEWRRGNGLSWADANGDGQITTLEMQVGSVRFLGEHELAAKRKENPDSRTSDNLTADIFRRYDKNGDKALDRIERAAIRGDLSAADINNNGLVLRDELSRWLLATLTSQPSSNLPDGLPVWFVESDIDLDGQVLLSEFLQSRSAATATSEFERYDHNSDGIVTADESVSRTAGGKKRYSGGSSRVFEAGKETHAELFIDDDVMIADIDVQVSITKNGHDDIELLLISPDHIMVTLYFSGRSKAWGGGRLFEDTIIDDEAPEIRQRLPLPPAHRSFRPQSMNNKNMASLSALYGKPASGTWRLVIRNKSRVAGLLEGWALLVKPAQSVEPN